MSSYLDAFTYDNNNNIVDTVIFPIGAIVPYLGTSDPPGWIICNGVIRTSSDNRYAALATLLNSVPGFSGNTANSITPPNLQNKFLYGASTNNSINTIGSNNTGNVTLSTDNLPSHTHTITVNNSVHSHTVPVSGGSAPFFSNGAPTGSLGPFGNGIRSINSDSKSRGTTASCANTGNGTAFSILPPYTTVNYIIKFSSF